MILPYSQGTSVSVTRQGKKIIASVNNLSTLREDWLRMEFELPRLNVTASYLETERSKNGITFSDHLTSLNGLVADLKVFPRIKDINLHLPVNQQGYYRRMILEALEAVIQAESFFIEDRGFSSSSQYDAFWRKEFKGNCRYYSNLDRTCQAFSQHISDQSRKHWLFSRQKDSYMEQDKNGLLIVTSSMRDSSHEMHTRCLVESSSRKVIEAAGKINRAPDRVCWETESLFCNLKDMILEPQKRTTIRETVGGPYGCSHFGNLMVETIFLIEEYSNNYLL